MKKLVCILFVAISINCSAQKHDTIEYCMLGLDHSGFLAGGGYTIRETKGDGNSYVTETGKWKYVVEPLGKLGSQGWEVVTRYAVEGGNGVEVYILKRRKL